MSAQRRLAQTLVRGSKSFAYSQSAYRNFASLPAVADAPVSVDTSKTSVEAVKPTEKAKPNSSVDSAPVKSAGSVWQRFIAFTVGVAVSSVYFYTTLREDIAVSSDAIESTLAAAKTDSAAVSEELRKRIAVLEHEVAAFKNK